jgi:hypothetical protein
MATNMHYGASKTIFQNAEVLRKNMTEAEKIFGGDFAKIPALAGVCE